MQLLNKFIKSNFVIISVIKNINSIWIYYVFNIKLFEVIQHMTKGKICFVIERRKSIVNVNTSKYFIIS